MYSRYWRAESLPFKNVSFHYFSIFHKFVAVFLPVSIPMGLNSKLKSLNDSISNTYHQIPFGFQPFNEIQFFFFAFFWLIESIFHMHISVFNEIFIGFSSKTVGYIPQCYEWITLFYYLLHEEYGCTSPI